MEGKYKEELREAFGIEFNSLYTMTNMPVKRFADFLHRRGELKPYMDLLVRNFNHDNLNELMCRNILSVNYDGAIFDCDFNQQLGLNIQSARNTVFDIESSADLLEAPVLNDNHCYGCMAGKGSS